MTATVVGELERTRGFVEYLVGRQLRAAETVIDVLKIDDALNTAKDDLDRAIRREMVKAGERALLFRMPVRMELTPGMVGPLDRLFHLGRREARAELQRAGYKPTVRRLIAHPKHPHNDDLADEIRVGLNGLSVRVEAELLAAGLTDLGRDAIAQALLHVPGSRFIAAAVIARAFTGGLAETFENNQDLVGGWEYTSVLDGGTCGPCEELDGTTYPSWEAIMEVLPNGGPNPDCDGGNRCRCRPVPSGA